MARIVRSESLAILRFGVRPGGDCQELHDVGMRIDASLERPIASVAEADQALGCLKDLRPYLASCWEGRLLLADDEPAALAYAAAFPSLLGRGMLRLTPTVSAQTVAQKILHDTALKTVKVSFEGGDSYIASALGDDGFWGSIAQPADAYSEWTKASSKTKFKLVRRTDRTSGADS